MKPKEPSLWATSGNSPFAVNAYEIRRSSPRVFVLGMRETNLVSQASQQSSTWNLVHHENHVRLLTRVHAPTRDHRAAWCLPAQIHHVQLGPHDMNRVHAQSHPATQHQTEQDQTAMN